MTNFLPEPGELAPAQAKLATIQTYVATHGLIWCYHTGATQKGEIEQTDRRKAKQKGTQAATKHTN